MASYKYQQNNDEKDHQDVQLINYDDSSQLFESLGSKNQQTQSQIHTCVYETPQQVNKQCKKKLKTELKTGFESQSQYDDFQSESYIREQEIDDQMSQDIIQILLPIKIERQINKETLKYPGESKNIPKNFARALREYIKVHFPNLNQKDIQSFMNLGCEQTGKQKLIAFINTPIGAQIGRRFFGDFGWALYFLKDNKADVGQYFRFYYEYYNQAS